MVNTDCQTTTEERSDILIKFCQKMRDSSYQTSTRRRIIISAVTKYYRLVKAELLGNERIH